ncbi:MAG TPA: hypothetical protein VG754_07035, partial [Verrucomicrobiae bacterium]|nr:hypothetical protein [Verrucomicrobiae bacterium]
MKSSRAEARKTLVRRVAAPLVEIFGLSWRLAFATVLFILAVLVFAVYWSIHTSPPRTIYISSG